MKKDAVIEVSNDEVVVLQGYVKKSPIYLMRAKAQAVLMTSKGMSIEDTADIFNKKPSTVTGWLDEWIKQRLASIFSGHQNNDNASKLSLSQKEEIKQTLKQPPSECGLPKQFWDVPQLKDYISATFGVVYESDSSYHYLLKFCGLSFKVTIQTLYAVNKNSVV